MRYKTIIELQNNKDGAEMSVLDRFWPKDKLVQKTIEIESGLYDEIEFLCENVYDTSVSKIINACIDELIETEDVKLYPKEANELFTKHSIILRKSSLNNLEKLKDKYGISVYKLIHIAIKNVLIQYHEEKYYYFL